MIITSVSFCAVASFPSGHLVPATERLLNEVHNAQPNKDGFWFRKLENMLRAVGQYRLEFELQPVMPGREPLTISTSIHVSPGPPAALEVKARAYSHCALPVSGTLSACVSARSAFEQSCQYLAVMGQDLPLYASLSFRVDCVRFAACHTSTFHALLVAL